MKILQLGTGKVLWEGADLTGADLTHANLTGADLTGADLTGADLTGADLTGADLTRADLTGANLTRADLTHADLTGADLYGANLIRANLIIGGQRSDGYRFLLFKNTDGVFVQAGCRYFTVKDARKHWKTTRKGTRLGNESLVLVDALLAFAKLAGWKV